MADGPKKPADTKVPVAPVFKETPFQIGTMYTRKGSGLIDDDLPGYLSPWHRDRETMHQRDEPEAEGQGLSKGGRVSKSFGHRGGGSNYGKDYRKK